MSAHVLVQVRTWVDRQEGFGLLAEPREGSLGRRGKIDLSVDVAILVGIRRVRLAPDLDDVSTHSAFHRLVLLTNENMRWR